MYSSKSYSRKYPKKYRKYSYNLKDIYSPSLYKTTTPNYFQQKGRVIQQSPRIIQNSPTIMMTTKKLDKMYKTLLKYKYQFPDKPLPQIQPFIISINEFIYNLFPQGDLGRNYRFGSPDLLALSNYTLRINYPELNNMYNFAFKLVQIQFNHVNTNATIDNGIQYFINWNTNLLDQGYNQIFIKSVDNGIVDNFFPAPISNKPNGYSSQTGNVIIKSERLSITNAYYSISSNNMESNDTVIPDTGYYPYIDTEAPAGGLYDSNLEFVPSTGMGEGDISEYLQAKLYILCIPIELL